jgi:MYXO-CTERM domain-containing protein
MQMTQKRSKVIVGVGVLCFVGMMAMWLASSGERAVADAKNAPEVAKSVTQGVATPVALTENTLSRVNFVEKEGLVQRLSVYVNLETADARNVKVYLTSPSGMKVLVVDGARSTALKANGLEGWFGADGLQTAESLAAFTGEPVTGAWSLSVSSKAAGKLMKWSLTTDIGSNNSLAGLETYGEYTGGGGGCDCNVGSTSRNSGYALAGLLLLGLVLVRRRS